MGRSHLYRTLLISSLFAAVGSFLIDVGSAFSSEVISIVTWLQHLLEADKTFVVMALLEVIAFAAAGLVALRVLSWWRGK
jgi:hypothetical protein